MARPQAKINKYNAADPAAPANTDSRGPTRGTYRGDGEVYDVKIAAGTLTVRANTIPITITITTQLAPKIVGKAASSI